MSFDRFKTTVLHVHWSGQGYASIRVKDVIRVHTQLLFNIRNGRACRLSVETNWVNDSKRPTATHRLYNVVTDKHLTNVKRLEAMLNVNHPSQTVLKMVFSDKVHPTNPHASVLQDSLAGTVYDHHERVVDEILKEYLRTTELIEYQVHYGSRR